MRYSLLIAILALLMFACGEVGNDEPSENPLSSGGGGINLSSSGNGGIGTSSSSDEFAVCQGQFCCNGAEYDNNNYFCFEEVLYPKCGNSVYDPYQKGCFAQNLYNRCDIETTRGTCVHNSLLRCRQEGTGEMYIRDPLPGMNCENNGAITGKKDDYRRGLDGKPQKVGTYKIVQIGNQIWMAENLNYDPGPNEELGVQVKNSMCYDDNEANCAKYGRLYDWATIMALPPGCNYTNENCPPNRKQGLYGGICPDGFGIARSEDWQILVDYAGGVANAASRLKAVNTDENSPWNYKGGGTDNYGFNALPGGRGINYGIDSEQEGTDSHWWAETQLASEADFWNMISSDSEARKKFQSKALHMNYLRCVHYF
ncbi:MAG: hypothetical protein FWC15_06820 [Fibromonadales bacterium]|nr:hypothetical protein [Fibromonadales bacterium]